MRNINESQQGVYEYGDKVAAREIFSRYAFLLQQIPVSKDISILDIGCSAGNFDLELKNFFGNRAHIYGIDSVSSDNWLAHKNEINFYQMSITDIENSDLKGKKFDLIFINRVVHHLVGDNYVQTQKNIEETFRIISSILSPQGYFCILDHFYNGLFWDNSTSYIIYSLTASKNKFLAKFIKRFGAESAGVGVCFLSRKKWLANINNSNMNLVFEKNSPERQLSLFKKILLLNKNFSLDNVLICQKK